MKALRSWKTLAAGSVLAAGMIGGTILAHGAHASYAVCRTDPTVVLSNGRTVTLAASVSGAPTDIAGVSYTLHIPTGVSVTGVSYDALGGLESLHVVADQYSDHYVSDTTVAMKTWSAVPVSVSMSVSGQSTAVRDGMSGQALEVSISPYQSGYSGYGGR